MKPLLQWFSPKGTLNRTSYASVGFLLFAIKYNVDRLVSFTVFDRNWYINDYIEYWNNAMYPKAGSDIPTFYIVMALSSLPFIFLGTVMSIRRLRDAGLQPWLVFCFFLPFLNLLFFLVLCLLPSQSIITNDGPKNKWLSRIIPKSSWGSAAFSIIITSVLGVICGAISIYGFGEYGSGLFLGIPFMQGLMAAVIFGYHSPKSYSQSLGVSIASLGLFALLIFVLAIEGVVCIVMAAPLGLAITVIGGAVGHLLQRREIKSVPAVVIIFAALPLLSGIEHNINLQPPLTDVTTKIIINKTPQDVWNQLVTFNELKDPDELIFRSGVAYPIKAEIEGRGVGSIRKCVFTTGAFIEPIEVWNEPHLLKFSVEKVPPPLVEISMYNDLHLPHLEGYFTSEKGQFKLTALAGGKTLLEGTTWYRHDLWPGTYWRIWSDHILHTIHLRVLNHIKEKAEAIP